jgi:hypothetical protein
MHDQPKALLKQAILSSLSHVQPQIGVFTEMHLVWSKNEDSQWRGQFEERPNIGKSLEIVGKQVDAAGAAFGESFFSHHPEYAGMVGFQSNQSNWNQNPSMILRNALHYLWWQHRTFNLGEREIDTFVQEFSDFIDHSSVRLRFRAQLLNFKMPVKSLSLPGGLEIRQLSEEEVSQFHGGPIGVLGFIRPRWCGPYEFVIEGELDEPKVLGSNHPQAEGQPKEALAKAALDMAVLSLRTFKEGHVGYDYIHFTPVTFCPIALLACGCGDLYIPFGSYSLAEEEIQLLSGHAKLIFGVTEEAMKLACSRLADAEHRTRPQDRIIDAVIGMEALLLAGIGKEDRRGELGLRFRLNYAMLFPTEKRQHEYKVARDLYGLRSAIAHGSTIKDDELKIAGEKVALQDAGKQATAALRTVIMHFLPKTNFPYKKYEFWERAYLGLPEPN